MKLIDLYKCLCDETRVRILNLLSVSPLCVCHIQSILRKSQVVISQHLAYLRERGLVTGQRYQSWMIYALPENRPEAFDANLKCIQNAVGTELALRKDLEKLDKLKGSKNVRTLLDEGCCARIAATALERPCRKKLVKKEATI